MELEQSYLYDFIFDACEYFSNLGYICNPSEVYELAGQLGCNLNVKLLLKTTLVHNSNEFNNFSEEFEKFKEIYFQKKEEERSVREKFQKKRKKQDEKMKQLSATRANLENKIKTSSESEEEKKAKSLEQKQKQIKNLNKCLSGTDYLKNFIKKIHDEEKINHEQLFKETKMALKKACSYSNNKEIMKAIKDRNKLLSSLKNTEGSLKSQLKNIESDISRIHQEMNDAEKSFQYQMQQIVKNNSISHRKEFESQKCHNSVKCSYKGDTTGIDMDKDFSKMTEEEKRKISDFIKDNARKFRTRLSRKIKATKASKINISDTIKKSCQTGGIPLRLMYEKPIRQKSNLILILDVSGSCKNASEMMLIFMHAMKEVFPGGCKTYAFTNKLYDISEFFEINDAETAAKEILKAIPRSGAYSNYYIPFETFYEKHYYEVTGDSYVYFIGDARNNKNKSGEDYVKAIARKAKKAFWLNTEDMNKWDNGDSIISTYAPYMTKVVQTKTPAELLGFLEG